ncbi:MAG TPA: ABC transporter permease [Candidatus Angelobacter sp.]|nr:ABC transporter permease [Candidatus Angelobacter sp.]
MLWLNRVWNTLGSRNLQRELDEELRLHLELRAEELERSGMSRNEAWAAAARQFGNPTLQTERMRTMDVAGWMETLVNDLRYAGRQFLRSPGFSAIAILSLALGIGANTAIFSVMSAILLRNLPVHDPQQLVTLTDPSVSGMWTGISDGERAIISYPEFLDLRSRLTTLSGLFASQSSLEQWQVRVAGDQQEQVRGRMVTEDYFSVLGVEALLGRVFNPQDATGPGKDPFVVLSYDFWQRRFGGRPDVVGTLIKLNGATLTVIGVAQRGFKGESGGQNPDLWIPVLMQPFIDPGRDWLHEDPSKSLHKTTWLHAFGRLKPGATLAALQAEVDVAFKAMMESFYPPTLPEEVRKQALSQHLVVHDARTGAFDNRDDFHKQLMILLTVAGLVLLIACANVANLLLARATARRREVAIRLSIGASRRRLFRQFLTESLTLSVIGGLAGLLIAFGGARVLVRLISDPLDPLILATGLDWRVLFFTLAVTLLTGMLFGLAPSLRASRTDLNLSLRESGHAATQSPGRLNLAKGLVVGQVALSLLLVIGAGLFLRTMWNLQSLPLGYPKENLLQVSVDGLTAGYKDQQLSGFYRDVADRLRTLPGVRGVTYSKLGLFSGGESNTRVEAEGFSAQRDQDRHSRFDQVPPGYFSVVGIPLLLGRDIGLQDTATSPRVCVVNEALVKLYFAGRNPIGLHLTANFGKDKQTLEIVGVVKNARTISLRMEIPQRFYLAVAQGTAGRIPDSIVFELRTAGDPKALETQVKKAIMGVNPDAPISFALSMEEILDEYTASEKMIARLCAIFGGLALVLAATGLYGVLSYGVARRTNEIGIRMALGAGRGSVVGMILSETGILVTIGLVVGLSAALACTRLIASQLYGLSKFDPVTFAASTGILCMVALIAGYIPAARASRVDPVRALRHE